MKQFLTKMFMLVMLLSLIPYANASAATTQSKIVDISKQYLGVPYVYGGTTPRGFDCSGFLDYIFNLVGMDLPRTAAQQYTVGTSVSKSNLEPGDLVFFKNSGSSGITHSGMYVGDNQFISSTTSKGVSIVSLSNTYWGPKYAGAKRVLEETGKFTDVSVNHAAFEAIETLTSQNVINGYADGTFQPESSVTRGQAAAIINRILGVTPTQVNYFSDVAASNPFAQDIAAIKELGIINGFSDGTFRPNNSMTRAEMAVIVEGAFELENSGYQAASSSYVDVSPEYWAFDAIVTMQSIDTTTVFDGNRYYSSNNATRAVFTTAIYNSLNAK